MRLKLGFPCQNKRRNPHSRMIMHWDPVIRLEEEHSNAKLARFFE